jgi:hypothetical protein
MIDPSKMVIGMGFSGIRSMKNGDLPSGNPT